MNKIDQNDFIKKVKEGNEIHYAKVSDHITSPRKITRNLLTINHDIVVRDTTFSGDLDLSSLEIKGSIRFENVIVYGALNLHGLHVRDNITFINVDVYASDVSQEHGTAFDLNGTKIGGRLHLNNMSIDGKLTAESLSVHSIKLNNVRLSNTLSMEYSTVKGPVTFERLKIQPTISENSNNISTKSYSLNIQGINVGGDTLIVNSRIKGEIHLDKSTIKGDLILITLSPNQYPKKTEEQLQIGYMSATSAKIGGRLSIEGAYIERNVDLFSIVIEGGGIFIYPRGEFITQIGGNLNLSGCHIKRGHIQICGLQLDGSLDMLTAETGPISLSVGTLNRGYKDRKEEVEFIPCHAGRIMIANSKIHGWLSMPFIQVTGTVDSNEINGISISQSIIDGDVRLWLDREFRDRKREREEITKTPVSRRELSDTSRDISPVAGSNSENGNITVLPSAWNVNAVIVGPIDISNTVIGGKCRFTRSVVKNHIALRDSTVKGDILFESNCSALNNPKTKQIDRDYLKANINCAHYKQQYAQASYLDLDMLQCEGDIDLTGLSLKQPHVNENNLSKPTGRIEARQVVAKGDIRLFESYKTCGNEPITSFTNVPQSADFTGVIAHRLAVSPHSFNSPSKDAKKDGIVIARGQLRTLEVHLGDLSIVPSPLDLRDISVDAWELRDCKSEELDKKEVGAYIAVLENSYPFKRSTYRTMEKYFRNRGYDREAEAIFRAMHDRSATTGSKYKPSFKGTPDILETILSPIMWISRSLWQKLFRYGTYPEIPFAMILILAIISAPLYFSPRNYEPSNGYLSAHPSYFIDKTATPNKDHPPKLNQWGRFGGLITLLRYHVPIIPIGEQEDWDLRDNLVDDGKNNAGIAYSWDDIGALFYPYQDPQPNSNFMGDTPNKRPTFACPKCTPKAWGTTMYVINWILWPIFLVLIVRRIVRASGVEH